MTVGRILVPVRGDGKGENVLAHAAAIARAHNAHVEVVHSRARPDDMIPYGVVVPSRLRDQIRRQAQDLADAEEASLRDKFIALLPELGLELREGPVPPDDMPTASWNEEQGKQADLIKYHGRLADIVAVAKPDRDRNLGVNTLKAALYHTGRPVLLCPPKDKRPESVGLHIAIAWNGAMQASRAIAMSLPLLQRAEDVIVLDGGARHPSISGDELIRYLAVRGVTAKANRIDANTDPGRVILSAAGAAGADLLIMGAYSHSREHETMFGGATQHVVDKTTIPVLMVH